MSKDASASIEQRLRQFALDIANGEPLGNIVVLDAAAKIERLRKALQRIDGLAPEGPTPGSGVYFADIAYRMGQIAREALRS